MELEPEDTVLFSSRVIPGNEESLARLYARLQALGVRVIADDGSAGTIHASGHPAREELRDMYRWIRPRIAIPVHGEPEHLEAHGELAKREGVPMQIRGRNGDLFLLAPQPGVRRGAAAVGRIVIER
jgi:ribonuclease J